MIGLFDLCGTFAKMVAKAWALDLLKRKWMWKMSPLKVVQLDADSILKKMDPGLFLLKKLTRLER